MEREERGKREGAGQTDGEYNKKKRGRGRVGEREGGRVGGRGRERERHPFAHACSSGRSDLPRAHTLGVDRFRKVPCCRNKRNRPSPRGRAPLQAGGAHRESISFRFFFYYYYTFCGSKAVLQKLKTKMCVMAALLGLSAEYPLVVIHNRDEVVTEE